MNVNTLQKKIRIRDVVSAELTKIISHPVAIAALALTIIINLAFAIIDAIGVSFYVNSNQPPATISSFGVVMFFPIYVFLILPVIAASSEYKEGQFRMTLTATPNRQRLIIGKLIAMVMAVLSAIVVALIPPRLIIGMTDGLSFGFLIVDLGRWIAVYLLMSIIAFGLAGFLRSMITPLAILIMIPIFVATGVLLHWPEILRFLPDQASMSLLGTPAYEVTELPVAMALLTLICWALLWTLAYWITVIRRDS
ncbi:hypothetical protein ACFSTH_10600 [Paenibacillus yanchengensis]|uniref:ABC transporter permease n=1 Tax=Paenibacillus yanchengensis TaxID=2035833 RepID=A0ABW4YJ55_9BACL